MPITLIGYRGTGKTTVANLLAQRLGCEWIDADARVEKRAGKTIKQIFEDDGEAAFRDLESDVIEELVQEPNAVLALGGGAIMREQNRRAIAGGTVVWLTASPETIFERIAADGMTSEQRPNLTAFGGLAEITTLLSKRAPIYRDCADFVVATNGRTTDEVAEEIVCLVQGEAAS
jgi:shikimate kinase